VGSAEPQYAENHLYPKEHKDRGERTAGLPNTRTIKGQGDGGSILAGTHLVQGPGKVRQFHTCARPRAASAVVGDNFASNLGALNERATGVYAKVCDIESLVAAYETLPCYGGGRINYRRDIVEKVDRVKQRVRERS